MSDMIRLLTPYNGTSMSIYQPHSDNLNNAGYLLSDNKRVAVGMEQIHYYHADMHVYNLLPINSLIISLFKYSSDDSLAINARAVEQVKKNMYICFDGPLTNY